MKGYVGRGNALEANKHFGLRKNHLRALRPGEFRVQTLCIGLSPSLRFALNSDSGVTSVGRVDVGNTPATDGVGVIVASRSNRNPIGKLIANKPKALNWPWRHFATFNERQAGE